MDIINESLLAGRNPLLKYEVECPFGNDIYKMVTWLYSEIGGEEKNWEIFSVGWRGITFRFKSEEDKIKFILRWL